MARLEIETEGEERILLLDGAIVLPGEDSSQGLVGANIEGTYVMLGPGDMADELFSLTFDQIGKSINFIQYDGFADYENFEFGIRFSHLLKPWTVRFFLLFESGDWTGRYSINEFAQAFSSILDNLRRKNKLWPGNFDSFEAAWEISFRIDDETSTFKEASQRYLSMVIELIEEAKGDLNATYAEDSVITNFNFPEEIRLSCEQYLLYFAQFLKDVGVDATAEIKHESGETGKVLFSVTPAGGKEALEKVRQALEVYLGLAQAPNMRPDFTAPVEVQALQRQIRYFQMEMDSAEAQIQHKDAAIALKDELIAQFKEGRVFAQAQKGGKKDEERKVALLNGLVILKRYDAKAVEIDLPALYDLLTKWFADENSTGNLPTYMNANGFLWPEDSPPALPPKAEES